MNSISSSGFHPQFEDSLLEIPVAVTDFIGGSGMGPGVESSMSTGKQDECTILGADFDAIVTVTDRSPIFDLNLPLGTVIDAASPEKTKRGEYSQESEMQLLEPLPESLLLHPLELYPALESIQKYMWPRLCKLDQNTLYELHYQMITFGKVFCTKNRPNCNACPMMGECSARVALPAPQDKSIISATENSRADQNPIKSVDTLHLPSPPTDGLDPKSGAHFPPSKL